MMKRNTHLYYAEYSVIIRLKSCRWFSAAFHHRCAVLAHICHPARHFNMLTCIHGFIRVAFWKCIETNRAAFKWDTRATISKMKLFDERIFSTNLSHKLEKHEHEAMKKKTHTQVHFDEKRLMTNKIACFYKLTIEFDGKMNVYFNKQ